MAKTTKKTAKARRRKKALTKKTRVTKKKPHKPKPLPGVSVGELNGFPLRRIKVKDLKPAEYNPRTISVGAMQGLKKSVGEFGLPQAVVWNKRTRRVVGGHQRLKALDPEVETDVVVVDLDETKEKALNLALNNRHIAGEFTSGLHAILAELQTSVPDLAEGLLLPDLKIDVPSDLGDFAANREEFDDILEGGKFDGSSGGKSHRDGFWFYAEFYGQGERFEKLKKLLGKYMRTAHEIEPEFFAKMVEDATK